MKAKFFLFFFFVFGAAFSAKSQSVYFMQYRFTDLADTALYSVFLVRYEDGKGFYRVRFHDYQTHEDMLVDLDMEQRYLTDPKTGSLDKTKLYFRGSNPQIVIGDPNYVYYPERFWFSLDKNTGIYEPWAVTSPDEKSTAQGKFVYKPTLVQQKDLTEGFVSAFFLKDEEFYKNLFTTVPRGLTPEQKKTQLHLIIVANTDDETIGNTCVLDKDRTLKTFKDLAEFLQIGFDPKVIYGDNFSKQSVENAVNALQAASKDIVIFYYSGHGFGDPNSNRAFPNMALSNKSYEDAIASSLNVEDVYDVIRSKGARFNLVISDCCNNQPNDNPTITCDVPRTRNSSLGWNIENCKSLFMNDRPMSIVTTAAQRGEKSTGNLTFGGYFTSQFRTSLTNYFGNFHQFPTWDVILSESQKSTVEQAENARCSNAGERLQTYKQHPVYRIQ